jgi:hypothetical protein
VAAEILHDSLQIIKMVAPGTPPSGYVEIYAKSDGLIYGKDDAGVETQLSNPAGGKAFTFFAS